MSLEQGERRWGRLSRRDATAAAPRDVAPAGRAYRRSKRALDVLLAGLALLVLSPFLLVISIAIWLTSPGPALIRQERLGRGRSTFMMLKFRTMYRDVDDSVHREYIAAMFNGDAEPSSGTDGIYKLVDDPRITRVGRLLRRTSLDELPQLINVAIGDMSLVGPRPILAYEADLLEEKDSVRFDVLPGITGLWQVSGRNALTMPQALELDAEYVQRRSLGLDVGILLKTIPVMLTGRGAG